MKSHHRRAEIFFFFLVFVKKVIMGSPACSTDVLAEYSTARAV